MNLITDGTQLYGEAMHRILKSTQALLMGRTIVGVGYIERDGDTWPCIVMDNGTAIVGSRDDEGNGPGSLFVEGHATGEILCRTSAH